MPEDKQRYLSRLTILGTSHVSEESVSSVSKSIKEGSFDIVCVELDKQRLHALSKNIQHTTGIRSIGMIKDIGITGFIFALIASVAQKRIGKKLKTQPGSDMMAAVRSAAEKNIPVALIDQDVRVTLKKLSKEVRFREKIRLAWDLLRSMVGMRTALNDIDKSFDLKRTPPDEIVEKILRKTKDRYGGLYKVLVEDRNKIMSKRILGVLKKDEGWHVVAVIGAGHKEGMIEELERMTGEKYDKQTK